MINMDGKAELAGVAAVLLTYETVMDLATNSLNITNPIPELFLALFVGPSLGEKLRSGAEYLNKNLKHYFS